MFRLNSLVFFRVSMGEAAKPFLFEGAKAGRVVMSFCVAGVAFETSSRVCKPARNRFV